jgi:predicted nucleic acid-binding protein
MTVPVPRLLVDCSVVVKWKLLSEPHFDEARELFLDWMHGAVRVCASDQMLVELSSALLRAVRQLPPRLSADTAKLTLQEVLELPFTVYRTRGKTLLGRAFDIAHQHNQRSYDCVYVALAERKRIDFWTGDDRLYNAFHASLPFVRRIADYSRRRA